MSLEFSIKTPIFVLSQIYEKNEPRGSLTTYELKKGPFPEEMYSFDLIINRKKIHSKCKV